MHIKILLNYIFGYITIQIEGYYIERFINICMKNGIFLWGLDRKTSTILNAKVGIDKYKELLKIAKQNGCRIKIEKKRGIPFLAKRYRKRKEFFILLICIIAVIFACSRFIWNIEITGNDKIKSEEILEIVNNQGLKVGTRKSKLKLEDIVNKIRIDRDDLAWVGIEIKGTNAIVKIVEAREKPEIVDESSFSNIVASKDAEIYSINAQNGTIIAEKGMQVKKGDLLIAGWMEGKYTGKYYVNSNGVVKGKVIYSQTEKIDKIERKKERTGNINKKYAIKIKNFKINFYKRLSKFKNYDTIYSNKNIKLFSNFYIPVELIKYTNYEIEETEVNHSKEEAENLGKLKAEEKLDTLIEGDIIDKNIETIEYDSYYEVKVTYTVIESIGTKEKIIF